MIQTIETSPDLKKFTHVLTDRNIEEFVQEITKKKDKNKAILQRDILMRASRSKKKIYHLNSKTFLLFLFWLI